MSGPDVLGEVPDLSTEQREALAALLSSLGQHPEFLGAILFGSTVEKGRGVAAGDIDVLGIMGGSSWFTGCRRVLGQKFDIGLRRLDHLLDTVLARRDKFPTRDIAAGQLVSLRNPLVAEIKSVAEHNWRMGPRRPKPTSYLLLRAMYENLVSEMRAAARDPIVQAYLHALCIHNIADDYYTYYGLYVPKWSYYLDYLGERSPRMAGLMRQALEADDATRRQGYLEEMVSLLLEPLGGFPPREWVIVENIDRLRLRDPATGDWADWSPPPLEVIQPLSHAHRIGLREDIGSDLRPDRQEEYRYWDDPSFADGSLPEPALRSIVEQYSRRPHVRGIVLFGSHSLGCARPDSDVDIYIITERRGRVLERRFVNDMEFGLEFVDVHDFYHSILNRSNTSYWRNMKEGTILFHRDPSVPFMKRIAGFLFQAGMPPLQEHEVTLERTRLQKMLEDGDRLVAKGSAAALSFTDNYLLIETIKRWFRLHNLLDTKRTYAVKELHEKDAELHSLVCRFLALGAGPMERHSAIRDVVEHVLRPFGGFLPDEWGTGTVPAREGQDLGQARPIPGEES